MTIFVRYEYRQHGKKTVLTGSDTITVAENTPQAILAMLRLLHPQWESFRVIESRLSQ
ncbi:hypothetical protein K788_0000051 [Paraburkholderia caribensis MBA4]|uniref:Uncharacterized protein n=1 Tax=Paraburkholderia caribensis MBA4 TaxID=1323664 RepID=A0A0N7JVE0_9BURK|nr:hypothetical protein K788_0000051 [Paraburkholderia caribensis MBA4]